MTDESIGVSFIIPAFNEESCISNIIHSIRKFISDINFEVIVINNGSSDNTANIAKESGAKVIDISKNTISYARNYAAEIALADVLIFLDADVRLTEQWGAELLRKITHILTKNIVTGSRYIIPENPSWIERNWFLPLSKKTPSYINGGNLVLSKRTFKKIGGFDNDLITGEDFEFSRRATEMGVIIEHNPEFRAIHDGYPKNTYMFIKREFWHGTGDCQNLGLFFRSNISMIAVVFGLIHILSFAAVIAGHYLAAGSGAVFLVVISLAMSARIFLPAGISFVFNNVPICYLYLLSRFASCLSAIRYSIERIFIKLR